MSWEIKDAERRIQCIGNINPFGNNEKNFNSFFSKKNVNII